MHRPGCDWTFSPGSRPFSLTLVNCGLKRIAIEATGGLGGPGGVCYIYFSVIYIYTCTKRHFKHDPGRPVRYCGAWQLYGDIECASTDKDQWGTVVDSGIPSMYSSPIDCSVQLLYLDCRFDALVATWQFGHVHVQLGDYSYKFVEPDFTTALLQEMILLILCDSVVTTYLN